MSHLFLYTNIIVSLKVDFTPGYDPSYIILDYHMTYYHMALYELLKYGWHVVHFRFITLIRLPYTS